MIYFYTVSELYNNTIIDDNFINAFKSLTVFAQKLVLEKNNCLRDYLNNQINSVYADLDFSQKKIKVDIIYIVKAKLNDAICPIHKETLVNITVTAKVNKREKNINLSACPKCKRFYLVNIEKDIKKLKKSKIKYEIIELESILNNDTAEAEEV